MEEYPHPPKMRENRITGAVLQRCITMVCMTLISLRLDERLVEAVDAVRGDESRSAWIRGAVEGRLGDGVPVAATGRSYDNPHLPKEAKERIEKSVPPAVEEVIEALPEAAVKPASELRYQCKVPGCIFSAPSPAARCPSHPGNLVAV